MFSENDYTKFVTIYTNFKEAFGKKITEQECRKAFNALKFSPVFFSSFCAELEKAGFIFDKEPCLAQIIDLAKYDGRSKEEAKAYAAKLWRVIFANDRLSTDMVFGDKRACIAFYICFLDLNNYATIEGKDKNEPYFAKRFIDAYMNCNLNDNLDVIEKYTVMFRHGNDDWYPRFTCAIGPEDVCREIADRVYGAGNYMFVRWDTPEHLPDYPKSLTLEQKVEKFKDSILGIR